MSIYCQPIDQETYEFQMFVIDEVADRLIADGKDVIKLTIGIAELEIPQNVLNAFHDTLADYEKTHVVYPQGLPELRSALANYYNTIFRAHVASQNVIVNVGSSSIFRNLFQLLCKQGNSILLPRPYYCLYLMSSFLAGAKLTYYDIDFTTGRIDMDSFKKAFNSKSTNIVVVNSPGNPLGNVVTVEEMNALITAVNGNAYIVFDEIYNNVCFYDIFHSPLAMDHVNKRNIIVTNAFSKGFRMYTKRVGYAILPDELIMPMRIVQQHTLLTADPVNQYGVIEALQNLDHVEELRQLYRERSEYTYAALQDIPTLALFKPEGGFYFMIDCQGYMADTGINNTKELAIQIANKVGVAVVPGTDFGMPSGIRLSFCNKRYNEGVDRLREFFT